MMCCAFLTTILVVSFYLLRKLPSHLTGPEYFSDESSIRLLVQVPPRPKRVVQKPQKHERGVLSKAFRELALVQDAVGAYQAGLPTFPRVFARDSIASALLMDNPAALRRIIEICMQHLGSKYDSRSGEEPGKVFHELPGVPCTWCNGQDGRTSDLNTAYNAIDTTPLFVIASTRYILSLLLPCHGPALGGTFV